MSVILQAKRNLAVAYKDPSGYPRMWSVEEGGTTEIPDELFGVLSANDSFNAYMAKGWLVNVGAAKANLIVDGEEEAPKLEREPAQAFAEDLGKEKPFPSPRRGKKKTVKKSAISDE